MDYRLEHDSLGEVRIPSDAYWGIHTARALTNFAVSGHRWPRVFISGLAHVKAACALTNRDLGFLAPVAAQNMLHACDELLQGELWREIVVDPFQGGAGTSTNMNLNEVIANRANELSGGKPGAYDPVHPLHHVNMHQSTNDVFPTGLKVAVLLQLKELEGEVALLQDSLQRKEAAFRDIVKVGRTQLQDAVPMTLGMEFGAYAEAVARDRWRIFKCRERIKQVNLGGTAIGTGLGAPRAFILRATDQLRQRTGLNVSRSENLVDATQNQDSFVEVSGMLKAYAANLMKIGNDLRILGSGPAAGLGEIRLPERQAGSSIMPGKVNPVMAEMIVQIALQVMACDQVVTMAAAMANLELNHLMPLLAWNILEALTLLLNGTRLFRDGCVDGIEADPGRCLEHLTAGRTHATVLVPALGYETVERAVRFSLEKGIPILDAFSRLGIAGKDRIERILSPKRLHKLGYDADDFIDLTRADPAGDDEGAEENP